MAKALGNPMNALGREYDGGPTADYGAGVAKALGIPIQETLK